MFCVHCRARVRGPHKLIINNVSQWSREMFIIWIGSRMKVWALAETRRGGQQSADTNRKKHAGIGYSSAFTYSCCVECSATKWASMIM